MHMPHGVRDGVRVGSGLGLGRLQIGGSELRDFLTFVL